MHWMVTAHKAPATAKNGKSCKTKIQPELERSPSPKPGASPKKGSLLKSAEVEISHPGTWLVTTAVNGRRPPSIAPQLAVLFLCICRFIKRYKGQDKNSHAANTPTTTPDIIHPRKAGKISCAGCHSVQAATPMKLTKMSGPITPVNVTAKTHWLNV